MPKISVLTATYNRADVLARAIESVQTQEFEDYEHLVVDDGSTDETAAVVADHADSRTRYLELDRNRGVAAAWNRGIEAARGEYLSFLDSDDEYLSGRLARTNAVLDDQPDTVAGVAHSYERVTDDGVAVNRVPDGEFTRRDLAADNFVCGSTNTIYRASAVDKVGGFTEEFPAEVDYDFQMRILGEFDMVGVAEPLSRKHDRPDSIQNDPTKKRRGVKRFLAEHGDVLSDGRVAEKYRTIARTYLETGDRESAARYVEKSLAVCPDRLRADLHYAVGRDYLEAGNKRAGRRHLRRSVRSEPLRYRPYALLALSFVPGHIERPAERARAVRDALGG